MTDFKINDLFRPGSDVNLNACVGSNGGPYDFYDYSLGYFRAAQVIAQSAGVLALAVDIAVYPLVYNFRHAVELGLKHLAAVLPPLFCETASAQLTHKLEDNWAVVRSYLSRNNFFIPDETIQPFEALIQNLTQFDPTGEVFRFPKDRKGNLFLQDASIINLGVVAEAIDQAENTMSFWHEQVLAAREHPELWL